MHLGRNPGGIGASESWAERALKKALADEGRCIAGKLATTAARAAGITFKPSPWSGFADP